jgi:hypothetical protein
MTNDDNRHEDLRKGSTTPARSTTSRSNQNSTTPTGTQVRERRLAKSRLGERTAGSWKIIAARAGKISAAAMTEQAKGGARAGEEAPQRGRWADERSREQCPAWPS